MRIARRMQALERGLLMLLPGSQELSRGNYVQRHTKLLCDRQRHRRLDSPHRASYVIGRGPFGA